MNTVYVIINEINSKCYVGKTTDVKNRKEQHFTSTHNIHLRRAFEKYGKDNFTFAVLEEGISDTEIDVREIFYIEKLNAFYNGYNQTLGGEGGNTLLDPTVAKAHAIAMVKDKTGKKRKPFSEEHKAKLRQVLADNPGYKHRSQRCIVEGQEYESQHAAARATGILQATINYRLKTNKPGYKRL